MTLRHHFAAGSLLLLPIGLAGCGGEDLTGPDAVARIEVSPASTTLTAVGETEQFSATALSSSGKQVREISLEWSSSDRSVVTVDSTGTATAAGGGTAQIRVSVRRARASASADVTVDQQVESVAVVPDSTRIAALQASRTFRLEATDANGNAVSGVPTEWSSSRPDVATIDGSGEAVAQSEGETRIVGSTSGVADTAKLVVDQRTNSLSLRPSEFAAAPGDSVTVTAEATDATGNAVGDPEITWSSSDSAIASVTPTSDTTARVTTVSSGTASVEAEAASGITATSRVTVGANVEIRSLFVRPRGVLEDSTVDVGAVVANTGAGDVQALDWSLRREGGTEVASGTIQDLAEGTSDSLPPQTGLGPFSAGSHRLVLEIDPDDQIAEFRESDNRRTGRLESYPPGYDIELQFVGQVADTLRTVARTTSDRWASVITGDLPRVVSQDSLDLGRCLEGAGKRGAPIDDLLVLVRSDSIDGEGGVLAQAGPCFIRTSDADPRLPPTSVVGGVIADSADVGGGSLAEIVLHELAHVIGFGTLWNVQGGDAVGPYQLLEGAGSDDPVFEGGSAIDRFLEVGGDGYDGEPVPVANQGGQGTRDSHWRESVFANELMTGFLNPDFPNPLSVVTIGSLADQFYAVNFDEADPFQVTTASAAAAVFGGGRIDLGDHVLGVPLYGVTPSGEVRRLAPQERR